MGEVEFEILVQKSAQCVAKKTNDCTHLLIASFYDVWGGHRVTSG
jgi:hypothetical protein